MKKQLPLVLLLALSGAFVFSLEGCGDEPPKIDPCKDLTPTSAEFSIGEHITNYTSGNGGTIKVDTVIVSDTVLNEQRIVFEAKYENDSYEWKIGEDTKVLNGKKVSLWFAASSGGFTLPHTLSVRLITKKKPNKLCFPNDDGVDTVVQKMTIIDRRKNPIVGQYEGYLKSNLKDNFTVTITYELNVQNPQLGDDFLVTNLPKGCIEKVFYLGPHVWGTNKNWWWSANSVAYGFRCMNIANDGTGGLEECRALSGWISIDKDGNIKINYYLISENLADRTLVKNTFLGRLKK